MRWENTHTHEACRVSRISHIWFCNFSACTDRYQAPELVLITVRGVWNNRLDPGTLATTVYFPVLCELFLQFSYTRRSGSTTVFSQCFTFTQCTLLSRGTTASCEFLLFVVLPLYTYVFMPYQTTRHQMFVRLFLFPEYNYEKCLILVFSFWLNREFHGFTRAEPRLFALRLLRRYRYSIHHWYVLFHIYYQNSMQATYMDRYRSIMTFTKLIEASGHKTSSTQYVCAAVVPTESDAADVLWFLRWLLFVVTQSDFSFQLRKDTFGMKPHTNKFTFTVNSWSRVKGNMSSSDWAVWTTTTMAVSAASIKLRFDLLPRVQIRVASYPSYHTHTHSHTL